MKKSFISVLISVSMLSISWASSLHPWQQQFIHRINQAVQKADSVILQQRQQLLNLYAWSQHHPLNAQQKHSLENLAKQYKLSHFRFSNKDFAQLIKRVDIVPASLAIAQAINESGWGHSRFAKQGNNYYGQWCYTKGCGMVPKQRAAGKIHEVRKFPSLQASVNSYIHNLNTHYTYKNFRDARHQLRLKKQALHGKYLIRSLSMYSQRRETYIRFITNIINQYHLGKFDRSH